VCIIVVVLCVLLQLFCVNCCSCFVNCCSCFVYCCSCFVCIVVILCKFVVICVLLFLFQMPNCWLQVSIRKVLRPATSTQVFLGFPVSISKCWDGSQDSQFATTCFSCSPSDLNLVVTNFIFCLHVKYPLPPGNNPIAVNNNYYHDNPVSLFGIPKCAQLPCTHMWFKTYPDDESYESKHVVINVVDILILLLCRLN